MVFLAFLSVIFGSLITIVVFKLFPENQNERIKNFYDDEMSTIVSPTTLKKWIDGKSTNYVLVDLRSAQEYNSEHFVTAINIPAVSLNANQLVFEFEALPKNKTIDFQIQLHLYNQS